MEWQQKSMAFDGNTVMTWSSVSVLIAKDMLWHALFCIINVEYMMDIKAEMQHYRILDMWKREYSCAVHRIWVVLIKLNSWIWMPLCLYIECSFHSYWFHLYGFIYIFMSVFFSTSTLTLPNFKKAAGSRWFKGITNKIFGISASKKVTFPFK